MAEVVLEVNKKLKEELKRVTEEYNKSEYRIVHLLRTIDRLESQIHKLQLENNLKDQAIESLRSTPSGS